MRYLFYILLGLAMGAGLVAIHLSLTAHLRDRIQENKIEIQECYERIYQQNMEIANLVRWPKFSKITVRK